MLEGASALSQDLLREVKSQFVKVHQASGDGVEMEDFSLADCGPIIVLEPGDNPTDLREVGLNPGSSGLLGASPEWCSLMNVGNIVLYNLCIVMNNEYAVNVICQKGSFNEEVERWLAEQAMAG